MNMQTKAKLRYLRVAPRKVRLLIDLVRGMKVDEALIQLQYSGKKAATPLKKLIESAIANAQHNHKMDRKTLIVKEAYVDGGPILYRWMPRAFGRASKIRKRTSHITVVLEGVAKEEPKAAKKAETKAEPKKPASKAGQGKEKKVPAKKKAAPKKKTATKPESKAKEDN